MQFEVASRSFIGSREEQQDAYYADISGDRTFAVICDGMGGSLGGAAASNATVIKLKELVSQKNPAEGYPEFFLRAIDILDEGVVLLQRNANAVGAGTTIVAVAIDNESLYWLAVGDSRLYIIRDKEIVQATRDHNFALYISQLITDGHIVENELRGKHRDDALISFIGIGGVKIYDINEAGFTLRDGDIVLLTSDGLTNTLSNEEIRDVLIEKSLNEDLDDLFNLAFEKSYGVQDNTTCVLIKIIAGRG